MSLIQSTAIPSGVATGYEIDQSLKFNDDDSAYLSRTPASAGNQKTWTFSCWVKKTFATNTQPIIHSSPSGNPFFTFGFFSQSSGNSDKCYMYYYDGSDDYGYTSTRLFRDHSAWYHIVVAVDTTQATESNRVKVYINGIEETMVATYGAFPQNVDTYWNNNNIQYIGFTTNATKYFDGYLAEAHSIDGQQLTPADFAETGDYGEWKPIEYEGTYGTNGFYLNFAGGGIMSATGGTITTDGDYKVHSFTSNGTFTPTTIANSGEVEYLVIGGGGGAGGNISGGGGAGGYRTGYLAVTKQAYTVTIGSGGSGGGINGVGAAGSNSVFSTITSTGGGAGGSYNGNAGNGGSGGGAGSGTAGTGTSGQGNNGGTGYYSGGSNHAGGGGGGAGAVGANGSSGAGGNGGAGVASSITGSSVTRAGGGAGLGSGSAGSGGSGGGGDATTTGNATGTAGTANTGGGGGGGTYGGAGGSGVVIIRYKFQ